MPKRLKIPIPNNWTKQRLSALDPQRPARAGMGPAPIPDADGTARLSAFFEDSSNGITWRSDPALLRTHTWLTVVEQYNRAASWATYRDSVLETYHRAERLSSAVNDFDIRANSSSTAPSGIIQNFPIAPNWPDPNNWFRLSDLLVRVGQELDPHPSAWGLPEIDQDFVAALDLIRSRLTPTVTRLQIAAVAVASERGRRKGSSGAALARSLRMLWETETGSKATVTDRNGEPAGHFVEYCELALDLLPAAERGKIGQTKYTIAEATRGALGKRGQE